MVLFLLEPEVAGEFGDNTIVDNFSNVRLKGEKPLVSHLHYLFNGWLGDELLECTPCFIVTEELAKTISESDLNGYTLDDNLEVSTSDEFKELYPEIELPRFKRIVPYGTVNVEEGVYTNWSEHDFCLSQKSYLVVSEKALTYLKLHRINYCDITLVNPINS